MTGTSDVEAFLSTLEKLPAFEGVTFRGCDARSHERWPGRALVTQGLVSTSRDPRVATENFTTEAVFAVLSRTGRDIEQFSAAREEREVVFLPGTVFTLVTRVRVKDLPVTIVEEFDPHGADLPAEGPDPEQFQETLAEIGRAILEAEHRDLAVPPRPGKFAGDIA